MTDASVRQDVPLESLVAQVADEFRECHKRGERPDIEAYAARHPQAAAILRKILASIQLLELSPAAGGTGPAAPESPVAGLPAPSGDAAAGTHPAMPLGDFRLIREIGRGGMGVVYEAEQLSLGRRVALKVLPFAATLDPKQLQRFKNEAQAAAHLHHTNIVPVFAVGCERGVHFYAMQLIEGQTLAALIGEMRRLGGLGENDPGPAGGAGGRGAGDSTLPAALATQRSAASPGYLRAAAQLGIQAAEALEHAHRREVVHRDVKPANLLVDAGGNLWVTDFGLAQFHADAGLTQTGDLLGTLRYMSPEQVRARHAVDHRTDLYSLGVTLYELLTLEPAFAANDRNELAAQIAFEEPPPPRRRNKAVPVELETIVLKAMDKDPAERYATAQELADDLRRFLEDRPIQAKRPTLVQRARKWSRRHKSFVVAAAVTAVALLTAGGGALAFRAAKVRAERDRELAERATAQADEEKKLAQRQKAIADEERELARRANVLAERAKELAEKEAYARKQLRQVSEYNRLADLWLTNRPHLEEEERKLIEHSLRLCQELAKVQSHDPQIRLETGKAYRRVGDLRQKLGRHPEAEQAYGQAVALLDALAAQFPDAVYPRYELALSHEGLGQLLLNTSRPREAEKELRRSLALYERLFAEFGNDPSAERLDVLLSTGSPYEAEKVWRQSPALRKQVVTGWARELRGKLARAHSNVGLVLAATRRPGEADRAYQQALTLQDKVVAEDPAQRIPRYDLAGILCNRGELLRSTGHFPEAREALEQAVAHFKKLEASSPTTPPYREGVAKAYTSLGKVLSDSGSQIKAERALTEAVERWQKLADDFPAAPQYRYGLATARNDLGVVFRATGRRREAENAFRQAQALLEKLAEDDPAVPEYRHHLARSRYNLGGLLEVTGRPREAEQPLRQAQALYEKLPKSYPVDVRIERASTLHTLALALKATDRAAEAGDVYRQAIALWEKLVEDYPAEPGCLSNLGGTLHNLAWLLGSQGQWADARPLAEQAVRRQEAALRLAPGHPGYGRLLGNHYRLLTHTLLRLGEHGEAARAADDLVRAFPRRWQDACFAADVLESCAALAERDDKLPAAGRAGKVKEYTGRIQTLLGEVASQGAFDPVAQKALTRFRALCPLPQVGDPAGAVAQTKQVLERSLDDADSWTTLGVALYRVGKYQAAVTALERAQALHSGKEGLDGFFLAMAYWRLGEKEKANRCYEQADARLNKNDPDRNDLRRVRTEAAALLARSE